MGETLLQLKNISKSFYGNYALNKVSLDLKTGNIHCIVGENGAGKSTLIKILTGSYRPDSGSIELQNYRRDYLTPRISREAGIAAVYQENELADQLSAAENIFACRERTGRAGFISWKKLRQDAEALVQKYGIDLPVMKTADSLTLAQKQYVKILKAVSLNPRLLIFDEPTVMMNIPDIQKVLDLVRQLKEEGVSLIYISHQLGEVFKIADEITVLRDGKVISTRDAEGLTPDMLTRDMVGRSMELLYRRAKTKATGEVLFGVEKLKIAGFDAENSFDLKRGEIAGITGMVGSGRTELLEALFGCRPIQSGTVTFKGKILPANRPGEAIKAGIGFITEDRQMTGLALSLSVAKNVTCVSLDRFPGFLIAPGKELKIAAEAVKNTKVKCDSPDQEVRQLSGGNQQKVILSRWILKRFDLLFLDEPTKGVDINAKFEIYALLEDLASRGKSFLIVSSDMPEVVSLCDRVFIMRKGGICGELFGDEITEENIITSAIGGKTRDSAANRGE